MLGINNPVIYPKLLNTGFPLVNLSLKIPLSAYSKGSSITPDCGYSSKKENSVLFIEAKGGGIDEPEQLKKFAFLQSNPRALLSTKSGFDIVEPNLLIDFAILCSDIEKIKSDHTREPIVFPVLYYSEKEKRVTLDSFNSSSFSNTSLTSCFSSPINVPRIPNIYVPFGPSDFNNSNSRAYILKNIFLMVVEHSFSLKKYERMPSLDVLIQQKFPVLSSMGKEEFNQLVQLVDNTLSKYFPDDDKKSRFNIRKYYSIKKGKTYIKKITLRKFIERLESELNDFEQGVKQKKLSDYLSAETSMVCSINLDEIFSNIDSSEES